MRTLLIVALVASAVSCAKDYVKVDDMALGRVVVYRNGVAYFERRAQLTGEELSLSVPQDKVDDFLKSLTVKDAATGESLPVSFPSPGASRGGMIDMKIQLPGAQSTDVILTYITEAPAWKPSYRIVVGDDGTVKLEGWAIVDNTSGEDWQDVLVGVGASSALSFRYDLWSIRTVNRQTLANEQKFAVAPPRGASTYTETSSGTVVTEFGDDDIPRPETHPQSDSRVAAMPSPEPPPVDLASQGDSIMSGGGGGVGVQSVRRRRPAKSRPAEDPRVAKKRVMRERRMRAENERIRRKRVAGKKRVRDLATRLRKDRTRLVIEGNAGPGESQQQALDRANVLRNQLIDQGVAPAQLDVKATTGSEGRPAGVRLLTANTPDRNQNKTAAADDSPVGESHFQSPSKMSVQRGSSVMVSIVNQKTQGEVVYLYDGESERGSQRFAFKAVRLVNPTKNTLETGPVTVYGEGRFVGEGLADPIPPESVVVVPFALDRQVVIERNQSISDEIASLVTLQRGVLTTEVKHLRKTSLKLTNRMRKPVTVYVRHTIQKGWNLVESPGKSERIGEAHLFPIALKGNETRTVAISEATPLSKTLDLRSPAALSMVKLYLSKSIEKDSAFAARMKELLAVNKEMADHQQAIDSLRERMGDYRTRMDELHVQIVTLKAVKSGGSLMKHLKSKLKDISERVQKATIALVNHQEKLMMARIRFQDSVAELTISKGALAAK